MSNILQVNNYAKFKQLTNRDIRQLGPLVHDIEEFTSTASQTVLNLTKIVCNLSQKSIVQVYVDGKLLREGSGNDYQWTGVSGGQSSQITFEYALPADLNIIVYRIGASAQSVPNVNSFQANLNTQRLELDQKDNQNGVINGSFDYWQRGTSFAAIVNGAYSADRWGYGKTGAMIHTISRSTDVPTDAFGQYSMLIDCTTADASIAAGDYSKVSQKIEGNFFRRFKDKKIVMKFWVKATKTGISCVSFRNNAGNRSLVKEYTINASNTWEQKTIRFTHDSSGTWLYNNGNGMWLEFILTAGSTYQSVSDTWQNGLFFATSNQVNHCDNVANDFQLADVHFCIDNEDQTKNPEFQLAGRDLFEELQLCQRYYEKSYAVDEYPGDNTLNANAFAQATASGTASTSGDAGVIIPIQFKVTKRVSPTVTPYSVTGAINTMRYISGSSDIAAVTNTINTNSATIRNNAAAVDQRVYGVHFIAEAEL